MMKVIEEKGIKIPNAILVSGITGTEIDEEVLDFLKEYGSISRTIPIIDPNTESQKSLIVEYNSGQAVRNLQPLLPYVQQAKNNPDISFHVTALPNIYTQEIGRDVTQTYLNELKALAERSGEDFTGILKEMLTHISEAVDSTQNPEPHDATSPENVVHPMVNISLLTQTPVTATDAPINSVPAKPVSVSPVTPSLPASDINPPEIQRVVVEHVVRTNDLVAQGSSPLRLRTFSGRIPHPPNEVDYETWRSGTELLFRDPTVSDFHRIRRICESLLPPAADVVKSVDPMASPSAYIQLLDSAFATVEDGDELFAKFMNIFQNPGEKASVYLQRLYTALLSAARRGGILSSEVNKHLLKQFCRGCWDNSLILELQLEQKKYSPPSFAELMTMLRTEEDKHASKSARMKQHLGTVKQRVAIQSQAVPAADEIAQLNSITNQLTSQIAELQSQLATLISNQKKDKLKPKPNVSKVPNRKNTEQIKDECRTTGRRSDSRPKPGYCFKCGEDGHIATSCPNEPNPTLVSDKRRQWEKRQREWELENGASKSQLN
ncbi:Zinc finger CCHC domain-containing protein 12 [Labeo rohita]|uniref:Zinc finger CCHC domain-containing protein 12 n=1 Tax=Labeo rohita TaxID=84645 RepID=A0ABQ8LPD6_LABRO|nr:Zinc finger CCHC domain-containing protein 12 [Labeo rohita]